MVTAAVWTIFAQPDADHATCQVAEVASTLESQFHAVATELLETADELTAFASFPPGH